MLVTPATAEPARALCCTLRRRMSAPAIGRKARPRRPDVPGEIDHPHGGPAGLHAHHLRDDQRGQGRRRAQGIKQRP